MGALPLVAGAADGTPAAGAHALAIPLLPARVTYVQVAAVPPENSAAAASSENKPAPGVPADNNAALAVSAENTRGSAVTAVATSAVAAPGAATPTAAASAAPPNPDAAGPAGEPLALKEERQLTPNRPGEDKIPVFVQGQKISGQTGVSTTVEGDAELRKRDSLIKAETITYWPPEDEMLAKGQVRVLKNGDLFTGTELRLKVESETGYFFNVNYLLADDKARGQAKRLDFIGPNNYRADDGVYTTCGPGDDDWYLKVKELRLDYGRDVGEAQNAQLYFLGQKIAVLPGMSFPLNDRRKSGFLTPSYGTSTQSGLEISAPYYWNIAPNRDLTLTEREMSRRGLQSSADFRYLGEGYKGEIGAEILPNDHLTNTVRSALSILDTHTLLPGLSSYVNVNKVSDNTYFTDLSTKLALTSQTYLPREGSLSYTPAPGYGLMIRAQSYQTLVDPLLPPPQIPYFRLPQVTFAANRYDVHGFDLQFAGDFTRFASSTQVMGDRTVINPSISYPIVTPGAYLTPTFSINQTRYHLQDIDQWQTGVAQPPGAQSFQIRTLPIFSVDSGLTFEKKTELFGQSYTQTLEPRLYYLNVPFRDQSRIPVFDTSASDFNFSQIFSNNRYSGYDRIGDANQLTFAVSTRLLDAENGDERIRATIGQRYYFSSQQVALPNEVPRDGKNSDFLAAISGEVAPHLRLDSALDYDPNQKEIMRVSHAVQWTPVPGNTVSAAYRYQRDLLEQVDVAAQWRIKGRWYAVARYNYSLLDAHMVEGLAGFEYDGGCWVGRVVVQRYALAAQRASTSLFFQIELNGLSKLGSNPLDVLRRNIPGYTKLNDNQTPQPRTFNNFE